MKKINILSLFDGICTCMYSLLQAGFEVNTYYASEVDESAIQIAKYNYPNVIQLGDIKAWETWGIDWGSINILAGDSPCTGFSMAGKRLNFNDPRSALFFQYVDILNHIKKFNPNVKFLLENVKMKKEWEDIISSYLGVEPILINSSLLSAQNRQRLYWANWKITQPEDKHITWGDIREHGVNEYYYTEKALQWLAKHSQKKHKTLDVWQDNEKAQMCEASDCKNYSSQRFFGICDLPTDKECIAAMRGRYLVNGKRWDDPAGLKGKTQQYIEFRYDGKSNALTTVQKDGIVVPFTLPNRIPVDMFFFRYKTPIESERLQTLPEIKNYIWIDFEEEEIWYLDHLNINVLSAEEKCHKILKLVGTVEKRELSEFVLFVEKNLNLRNQLINEHAAWNVLINFEELNKEKDCLKKSAKNVNCVEKNLKWLLQKVIEDFVRLNVGENLVKKSKVQIGKVEFLQKEKVSLPVLCGKEELGKFGKETMLLVKNVKKDIPMTKKLMKYITSFPFVQGNVEQNLVILYYFVHLVINGFTQKQIKTKILLETSNGYTKYGINNKGKIVEISKTARYKALGNGWTAAVITHIFNCLKEELNGNESI